VGISFNVRTCLIAEKIYYFLLTGEKVQEEWCLTLKQIKIQTQLTSFLSSKRGGVKLINRFLEK